MYLVRNIFCYSIIGFLVVLNKPYVRAGTTDYELIKVTVFYESLCPDSIDFFKNQLKRTWLPFYDYIQLDLVPYGNAEQKLVDDHYVFTCQHGEEECYQNKIQACAIHALEKNAPHRLYKFICCVMSHDNQRKYGPICAGKYRIKYPLLAECASSSTGDRLLARYGNRTHNFTPKITWIPTIAFNDNYNKTESEEAEEDLKSVICSKIPDKPEECYHDEACRKHH